MRGRDEGKWEREINIQSLYSVLMESKPYLAHMGTHVCVHLTCWFHIHVWGVKPLFVADIIKLL